MTSFLDDLTAYTLSLHLEDYPPSAMPLQWTILSNGGADLHAAIILFGFEGGKLFPSFVAKTPRLPKNGGALQVEYEHLFDLWKLLGKKAALHLAKPLAMVTLHDQPVMITSYVQGKSLSQLSKKAFWDNQQHVLALAVDAAHALRDILDQTVTPLAEGERVPSDFPQRVVKFKQTYSLTENENRALESLLGRIEASQVKVSHKVLIQGDFWHGNLIYEAHTNNLIFVDWQHSRWATDASLDVYFFLIASALASAPKDSACEMAKSTVNILLNWRAKLIPVYLAAFGKPTKFTLLPIKDGMLVCCIEKAVRACMDYGYNQADDEIWRFIFTELINWPE